MRPFASLLIAAFCLVAAGAWVVETEPDWYLRTRYPLSYEPSIRANAEARGIDPALLAAVVYVESRFDPNARSEAGALGLMQLLPETAEGIALRTGGREFVAADLRDPEINIRYGSWYLAHLAERYGSSELALAAYHAGQGNLDRWLSDSAGIAFPETREYVAEVERARRVYADAYRDELGLR
jgi:soluble lytic murein transglycosylase